MNFWLNRVDWVTAFQTDGAARSFGAILLQRFEALR